MPGECPHRGLSFVRWRSKLYKDLFAVAVPPNSPYLSFLRPSIHVACYATNQSANEQPRTGKHKTPARERRFTAGDKPRESRKELREFRPYSEAARDGLAQLVSGLRDLAAESREANKHDPSRSIDLLQTDSEDGTIPDDRHHDLPKSPIHKRLEALSKRRVIKPQPSHEQRALDMDPWAKMLASPVRMCQASGVRLPIRLFTNWRFMQHPETEEIYIMPGELAALDEQELETGAVEWREQQKADRKAFYEQRKAQEAEQAERNNSPMEPEEIGAPSAANWSFHKPPPPLNVKPVESSYLFPGSRPAIRITPYSELLTMMTDEFTRPNSLDEPDDLSHRMDILGAPARIVPRRWRERIATAQHYERHKKGVQAATANLDFRPAPIEANIDLRKIRWQRDIQARLRDILRRRVIVALNRVAETNSSTQAKKARRVSAIAIPGLQKNPPHYARLLLDDPEFDGEEGKGTLKADPRLSAEAVKEFPTMISDSIVESSPNSTIVATSSVDAKSRPILTPYRPLQARFFLYIGTGSIPDKLPFTTKNSIYIPPLLVNYAAEQDQKFPVFPLYQMLGEAYYTEALELIKNHDILQFKSENARDEGQMDRPENDSEDYLIMVKVRQAYTEVMLAELWRLWRYVGGKRMLTWDRGPSEFDPADITKKAYHKTAYLGHR